MYKVGSRFFITGCQLGILKALTQLINTQLEIDNKDLKEDKEDILELLEEIEDKQYLCEKEELHKILKKQK